MCGECHRVFHRARLGAAAAAVVALAKRKGAGPRAQAGREPGTRVTVGLLAEPGLGEARLCGVPPRGSLARRRGRALPVPPLASWQPKAAPSPSQPE